MKMGIFYAVMWLLLAAQMLAFSHYKVRGKGKMYTLTKMAGGVIFTGTAIAAAIVKKPDGYTWLIITALCLSMLGDYHLAQPAGKHRLKLGAVAFICAHVFFGAGFITLAGFHWQAVAAFVVAFGAELAAAFIARLNCRGADKSAAVYIAVVTFMASLACTLPFFSEMDRTAAWMTAAGGVLFLVSDIVWMLYGLDRNAPGKALKIANVFTYFPAQLLIAGALLFR